MKLKVKSVTAEFINSGDDYTMMKMMGSPTLIYGDGRSKKTTHKGIAFKDTKVLREVVENLLKLADFLDSKEKKSE